MPDLRIRVATSIDEIPAAAWDACAGPTNPAFRSTGSGEHAAANAPVLHVSSQPDDTTCHIDSSAGYNPFISHDFLFSLEKSKSVSARAGWQPQHVVAETRDGGVLGVVPCYLKSHSRGEYVFDHGWAEAYERAGGSYYPKLQVSVPFTPVTGRRLLVAPGPEADAAQQALAAGLVALCERREASSVHLTFLTEPEWNWLGERGFLRRTDQQFHWENAGYTGFDGFLEALASRKRKAIRRERRDALADGITVHWLSGSDLTEAVWDAFFNFYIETGSRKWGRPYLNREFYSLVGERMGDRILLVMAKRAGRWIAGAINFIGSDTLFGRHWGAIEHHPFLHFELCYYQAIDFAIGRGLAYVEAGAQGEHKLARGYVPRTTYSAHHIADPALRRAVADYLKRERAYVAAAGEELAAATPFRKGLTADGA
jgi:hypothetical protein